MEEDFFYKLTSDKRFVPTIEIFIAILFGLIPFLIGFISIVKSDLSKRWEESTALVKSTKLESHKSINRDDNGSESTSHTYRTVVSYEYTFDGQKYEGNRIAYGYKSNSDYNWHNLIHNKLHKAEKIKIWVNPNKPSKSTIVSGFVKSPNMVSIPALIFGYVVCTLMLFMLRAEHLEFRRVLTILLQFLFVLMVAIGFYVISNLDKPDLVDQIEVVG